MDINTIINKGFKLSYTYCRNLINLINFAHSFASTVGYYASQILYKGGALSGILFILSAIGFLLIGYLTIIKVGFEWQLISLPFGWIIGFLIGLFSSPLIAIIILEVIYWWKGDHQPSQSGSMAKGIIYLAITFITALFMMPLCATLLTFLIANIFN